jgi:hypothetical protein
MLSRTLPYNRLLQTRQSLCAGHIPQTGRNIKFINKFGGETVWKTEKEENGSCVRTGCGKLRKLQLIRQVMWAGSEKKFLQNFGGKTIWNIEREIVIKINVKKKYTTES